MPRGSFFLDAESGPIETVLGLPLWAVGGAALVASCFLLQLCCVVLAPYGSPRPTLEGFEKKRMADRKKRA